MQRVSFLRQQKIVREFYLPLSRHKRTPNPSGIGFEIYFVGGDASEQPSTKGNPPLAHNFR